MGKDTVKDGLKYLGNLEQFTGQSKNRINIHAANSWAQLTSAADMQSYLKLWKAGLSGIDCDTSTVPKHS